MQPAMREAYDIWLNVELRPKRYVLNEALPTIPTNNGHVHRTFLSNFHAIVALHICIIFNMVFAACSCSSFGVLTAEWPPIP